MSARKVPYLQDCPDEVFSIFKLAALPLARVSTFSVELEIVNGPKGDDAAVSTGKSFKLIVICALPVILLKSGMNLLILVKNSPLPSRAS